MTIIIIDDDRIVSQALKTILSQDASIEVLATGASYEDALSLHRLHRPDLLLMDIRMGARTGLDAAEAILLEDPDAHILFLTTFSDEDYIKRALLIGAKGYLLKQDYENIIPAIKAVHAGQTVYGGEVMQALPRLLKQKPEACADSPLTEREREIWQLVAEGLSNREISARLYLSEGTVRNYVSTLLQKCGQRDRTQLAISFHRREDQER